MSKRPTKAAPEAKVAKPAKVGGSHADAIYRYLEQEIVSGRLQPGEKLDDVALAERFGVSKTPIREAILQLTAIDFVQVRQRVGAIVAPLSLQRMVQMFEVMATLEAMCAGLAAARMTSAERELLEHALACCQRHSQGDSEEACKDYTEANFNFHEIVYRGSHNDYLCEQASHLRKRLAPYRRFWLTTPSRMRKSCGEHEQVARAILGFDEPEAERAMKAHLTMQTDLVSILLEQLPPSYLTVIK
ncbi:GntR family transcriptional regulator [Xanthobacter tagetidis]|jgi:DNA-binding GntR family transcriptional regulator|nr:GntR family transcriptional regulator [Xanthobacter tagetidis]MBB6310218.1 DNA-binding GntR family transcriptional regulator [Xanthobacter tagetidis]